ncbi:MAG: TetR/AcrR family transcriptional regulator [Desulfobacterales bacterium]|nr:TetR/AcrR family transcriptional regulator [Desulfobacterales bacterium]
MGKGEETKLKILDKGLELASTLGLEGLTIGVLARETGMSKSGLFAHFNSKQALQISVMEHAAGLFSRQVIVPALKTPAGIPRIRRITENWIQWTKEWSGGCIFIAAPAEYSDRPGKVRDCVMAQQSDWIDCLTRIAQSAKDVGDFRPDIDCPVFAFELYSLIMGFFIFHDSLDHPDVDQLMEKAFDRLILSCINPKP